MSEQIVKPDREPDFIDLAGGYYWFTEMIYLSGANSQWYMLELHPKFNVLAYKKDRCKWCKGCEEGSLCSRVRAPKEVNEAREKWMTDSIESAIFGVDDEGE